MKQFLNDEIFKNIFVFIEKNPTCHFFNIARGGGISWIYCLDMKFYIFGPDLIMDFLFSVIRVNKNNINEHKNQADKNVFKKSQVKVSNY